MRLSIRDLIATLLVAAIGVPYVGFLVNGEMPFIKDPRGMSPTALVLGAAAFLCAGRFTTGSGVAILEIALALLTTGVGACALMLAVSSAAYSLLAILDGQV